METLDWQQVREIFAGALEVPDEQRKTFVAARAAGNPALLEEVASLLAAFQRAEDFLGVDSPEADPLEGRRVGPYQVLKRLGRGGMGVVYLAARADEGLQRRVALKVLHPGMHSQELVRRFDAERQILAALDHPDVARFLDGGSTTEGLPYLVMEYVEGQPIDSYCADRGLDVTARLHLFRRVLAAVQFAHQNLVVHRDLKPGNILVTAAGQPKLLDFGIAKVLDPGLMAASFVPTAAHLQPMTPEYASPEQLRGGHIGTASDVFSLGALLYELLVGRHPFRDRAANLEELRRLVSETEPEKPSEAVIRPGGGKDPASLALRRRLRGDLDAILLTALAKSPDRRYATVEQFSEDLRRHLEGKPILARTTSAIDRTRKFVRRHRRWVAAAAALALVVLSSGLALVASAASLTRERDRAQHERQRAEQVTALLVDLFELADPAHTPPSSPGVKEILDAGTAKLGARLYGDPALRSDLMMVLGTIYQRTGELARAETLLGDALATRRQLFGPDHAAVAESLHGLGLIYWEAGRYLEAEAAAQQALDQRRQLLGERHEDVGASLHLLACILAAQSRLEDAEAMLRQALEIRRKAHAGDHPSVAESLNTLGALLRDTGRAPEAEAPLRQALAMRLRLFGDEHLGVAVVYENLGSLEIGRRNFQEAAKLQTRALAIRRRFLGEGHHLVADSLSALARAKDGMGEAAAAEATLRQAIEVRRRAQGDRHPQLAFNLNQLAGMLVKRGAAAEAETLVREALAIRENARPRNPTLVANSERMLAHCLVQQGRAAEARAVLGQSLGRVRAELGPDDPLTGTLVAELRELR